MNSVTQLGRGMLVGFVLFASALSASAFAADAPLEQELESLSVPANQAPSVVSQEKLYAVQGRYAPLRNRHELSLAGAKNFTADSFLSSQQLELGYRYYLSDRWFAGLNGSYVFNSFTEAANRIIQKEQLVPDVAYAKYRADVLAGFQPFYGKFRLTMDQVFYFDQYVALGAGLVGLDTGSTWAVVADVGFSFRFGRAWSFRLGVKDYFFEEQRRLSKSWVHNLLGHLDVAMVL